MKPIAVLLTKTRFLKSDSGMIGSSARFSATMNPATAATSPTPKARVSGEVQPWSALPPKSVKKIMHVVATDSSTTPARSIFFVARWPGRVSATYEMANAATPTGTLM